MLLVAVLSGFAVALLAPWVQRLARGMSGWLLALFPAALAAFFLTRLLRLAPEEAFTATYAWIPSLDVTFSLYADGLGLLFALLISGIGTLIVIYAGGYVATHPQAGRFHAYLMLFMASMLGLVLVDNLLTLYVFWELTSLSSYLLIGFEHRREAARGAALQALLVTSCGGLAMLAGLILLGHIGGTFTLSALIEQGAQLHTHPGYVPALCLIFAGAFTKSAQFPFHFWLPNAMEALTPVSAYLHSATMVKAGIYLLARLHPAFGDTAVWQVSLTGVGTVTMILGAWLAMQQTDLKRLLAYLTVSALGMLTMLLGVGTPLAVEAMVVFLLVHSLYKGALFLTAGAVDHETGTREVTRLGGLLWAMPLTACAAGLAALSLAGLPPLIGFIGKELVYEAVREAHGFPALLTAAAVLSNALFVAAAGMVGFRPFLGRRRATPQTPHEAPVSLWLGPLVLALASIAAGLWSEQVGKALLTPAATAVLGRHATVEPHLWHGWTPEIFLSILTLAVGIGLYAVRRLLRRTATVGQRLGNWGPSGWYDAGLEGLHVVARLQTALLQNGYLRTYLLVVMGSTIGLVGLTLVLQGGGVPQMAWESAHLIEVWLAGLIIVASVVTVHAQTRLGAVVALGVVGYGVALFFVLFSAPDLAITQFLIETLTVILFVLVFYRLPDFAAMSSPRLRLRDSIVALLAGGMFTMLVLLMMHVQWYVPISHYFAQHSLTQAHGRNIVNVILVDFRSLDTLGEITVLAVAGLGILALLRLRPKKGNEV